MDRCSHCKRTTGMLPQKSIHEVTALPPEVRRWLRPAVKSFRSFGLRPGFRPRVQLVRFPRPQTKANHLLCSLLERRSYRFRNLLPAGGKVYQSGVSLRQLKFNQSLPVRDSIESHDGFGSDRLRASTGLPLIISIDSMPTLAFSTDEAFGRRNSPNDVIPPCRI